MELGAAVAVLASGGLLAYPTEGVWGLGCDPRNEAAVHRLLAVKQRAVAKGLVLVAADIDQLRPWVDLPWLPPARLAEVLATWPGPHTWVLPASTSAPAWIRGQHAGIAVRVSAHPAVQALCRGFGAALVSTSANLAGEPAVTTQAALDPRVIAAIDGVLVGETGGLAAPTPIRDALTGAALRS